MDKLYYAVIERSDRFCLIDTGHGSQKDAWDKTNRLARKYPQLMKDCDVLYFTTEIERISFLCEQAKQPDHNESRVQNGV